MLNQIKTPDTLYLIGCSVGDETYGLDMAWVRSIERTDQLLIASELDTNGTDFVGWLPSHRGDIPVFNLATRLGRSPSSVEVNSQQRIIVLPSPVPFTRGRPEEGRPWALLVDGVSEVIRASGDRFESLPRIVANTTANYFEGVIKIDQSLILFLSPEWLHPDATPVDETTHKLTRNRRTKTKAPNAKAWPPKGIRANTKNRRIMVFSTPKFEPDDRPLSFGLSITQVPEVLRPLPLIPVPAAPPFVLGLVNWRDRAVPIIDLDTRLGLGCNPNLASNRYVRLMIARGMDQNALVGFLIQPAVKTLQLPIAHQLTTRSLAVDQTLVRGMVELENETLIIPDVPAILG